MLTYSLFKTIISFVDDETRVILETDANNPGDYINASFINVHTFNVSMLFSSPEHEVLMVSYCGQWLSVVRRRASSVVRRASSVNI